MSAITICQVSTREELVQIQQLQQQNLRRNLSNEEAAEQGFVTAEYELSFLEAMHAVHPSIIARHEAAVVGYALVATRETGAQHELLADLFGHIDATVYKGSLLQHQPYVVVGQLCVARAFRGKGLVNALYQCFRENLSAQFRYGITDVARNNPRSLKAHLKAGFQVVNSLHYGGVSWDIVLWDWTTNQ